jgi:hypothetical protein
VCSGRQLAHIFALNLILQAGWRHLDHSLTSDISPFRRIRGVRQLFRLHLTLLCHNHCIDPPKNHTVCSGHQLAHIFALNLILQAGWRHLDHSLTSDISPFRRIGGVRQLFRLHLTLLCHNHCIDPPKNHTVCSDRQLAHIFALNLILQAGWRHLDHSLTSDISLFRRIGGVRQLFRLHLTLLCHNHCIDPPKNHTVCSDRQLAHIFALNLILQAGWRHLDHSLTSDISLFRRIGGVRQLLRLHGTLLCHNHCIDCPKNHTVCSDHQLAHTFAFNFILQAGWRYLDHPLASDIGLFRRIGGARQLFRLHWTLLCHNYCIDSPKNHTVCSDHQLPHIFAFNFILQAGWRHLDHPLASDIGLFRRIGGVRQLFRLHWTSCVITTASIPPKIIPFAQTSNWHTYLLSISSCRREKGSSSTGTL